MISIFFSVCSIVAGAQCKDIEVPLRDDASMMACMMRGQFDLAAWAESHPNWNVVKYRCGPTGQYANL